MAPTTETDSTNGGPPSPTRLVLVVPCYNEAHRLNMDAWDRHLREEQQDRVVFVDDGSADGTLAILSDFAKTHPRAEVVHLANNSGKAEAVRQGVLHALRQRRFEFVGYWDADLSASLDLIQDFMKQLDREPEAMVALGVRVREAGHEVHRPHWRHLVSRLFALTASMVLGLPVRDTQCGAKIFRYEVAGMLFKEPFLTQWLFDIEVLARMIQHAGRRKARRAITEVPLREWRDKEQSRFFRQYASRAPRDLLRIWWHY